MPDGHHSPGAHQRSVRSVLRECCDHFQLEAGRANSPNRSECRADGKGVERKNPNACRPRGNGA